MISHKALVTRFLLISVVTLFAFWFIMSIFPDLAFAEEDEANYENLKNQK